jgi:hypothetical protein
VRAMFVLTMSTGPKNLNGDFKTYFTEKKNEAKRN